MNYSRYLLFIINSYVFNYFNSCSRAYDVTSNINHIKNLFVITFLTNAVVQLYYKLRIIATLSF